ncbi:hypothetical protein EG878_14785 [Enterococcus faecalis]|nr:hypothetical protein EG878_14785 [Enterococcus faecalis]
MRTVEITKEAFASMVKDFRVPAKYYEALDADNAYYTEDDEAVASFKAGDYSVTFFEGYTPEVEANGYAHDVKSVNALRAFLKAIIELGQPEELTEEQDENLYSLYNKCFR